MGNEEKQNIVENEMQNLVKNKFKVVIVNKVFHDKNIEIVGILEDVLPFINITVFNGNTREYEPFIGECNGISKVTERDTGLVLYENTTLNFNPKTWDKDLLFARRNNLRVLKYGTDKYNSN